ncbi:cytochrome P450 [Musa troglodytarum]|uniref:Cytochrome P450 n=1 Tax=Musa troglodytarum TaxID=320322 RepID=A0A9E7FFL6_9LILI|nr:cytochrome P450 [Musa troglodytarum]
MFLLLQPLALLFLTALFLYPLFRHAYGAPKSCKLPPGSFGWLPLIGKTMSFINPHLSCTMGQFLEENIKRYGKIFRSHLFGHPTVVSCDVDFNHFILQNEDRLFEASYPVNIPKVIGDFTMLVMTGDAHKRIRGVALSLFSSMKTHEAATISDIDNIVVRLMDSWQGKRTLVFCDETRKFTFSVIVKHILSLSPEDPETVQLLDNYKTFMKGFVSAPIDLPGTSFAKAKRAKLQITKIVGKIRDRRQRQRIAAGAPEVEGRKDFLDLLESHGGLTEDEIFGLVIDLLIGGYETTAMLISIIVKFVGKDPEILSELRAEHAAARKKAGDEPLKWQDYKDLRLTQCLINEALRLGNVVKFVHRKAIKPVRYKELEIPAGWKVLPILSGIHLDGSLHNDPFRFNPRRWQKEEVESARNFMPFGGGKRLCPGSDLTWLDTSIFLHHLLLKYSWKTQEEDDWPMSFPFLDFKKGLKIAIQPLNDPCPSQEQATS